MDDSERRLNSVTAPPGKPGGFYGFATDGMQPQANRLRFYRQCFTPGRVHAWLPGNRPNTDYQGTPSGSTDKETFPPSAVGPFIPAAEAGGFLGGLARKVFSVRR